MAFQIKVNGVAMSLAEYEKHKAEREAVYGSNFDDMVKAKVAPSLRGDDTTFHNRSRRYGPWATHSKKKIERMVRIAKAAGLEVGPDWDYQPGLANFEDDPAGWVAPSTTVGDIQRRLEAEGNGSEMLGVKVQPREAKRVHRLAPDIVERIAHQKFRDDPALLEKCRKDDKAAEQLKQDIIDHHGAPDNELY